MKASVKASERGLTDLSRPCLVQRDRLHAQVSATLEAVEQINAQLREQVARAKRITDPERPWWR